MDAVLVHGAPEGLQLGNLIPDNQEFQLGAPLRAHQIEGFEQPLEVLVRLDVADVEQVGMAQLIALSGLGHQIVAGGNAETLIDGVGRDDDLLRGDLEELQDVELGLLGHGEDPVGLARGD
jgi:hypothetical protein